MAPISTYLIASLAGIAAAYPGMSGNGLKRKAFGANQLVDRSPQAAQTSSAAGASSTYPAWHPPQAGEVRSPCPALNTLANHDICPRSGKGYTVPILIQCLADGMSIGADFATIIGTTGVGSNPNPLVLSFDLDMLDRHDAFIEHDASLSRADASTGDDHTFNSTIWDTVLAYYNASSTATIPTAGEARYMRINTEKARDPEFSFGPTQLIFQAAETALYLSVMGDPSTGNAPVEYVRSLFEEERLPYELGWTKPAEQTTIPSLFAMVLSIMAATGETIPDVATLTEYSFASVYLGVDAATDDVANAALYAASKLTGALGVLTGLE